MNFVGSHGAYAYATEGNVIAAQSILHPACNNLSGTTNNSEDVLTEMSFLLYLSSLD